MLFSDLGFETLAFFDPIPIQGGLELSNIMRNPHTFPFWTEQSCYPAIFSSRLTIKF